MNHKEHKPEDQDGAALDQAGSPQESAELSNAQLKDINGGAPWVDAANDFKKALGL